MNGSVTHSTISVSSAQYLCLQHNICVCYNKMNIAPWILFTLTALFLIHYFLRLWDSSGCGCNLEPVYPVASSNKVVNPYVEKELRSEKY